MKFDRTYQFTAILLFFLFPLFAQQESDEEWILIASKTVSYTNEEDVITLNGAEKEISRIMLKCIQGSVSFRGFRAEMEDGGEKTYKTTGALIIPEGGSSMSYDLPGKRQKVKRIILDYDAGEKTPESRRAKIEIWGQKWKTG
ncbi:hypothetical protein [Robertkochia aurantiaca]|uniref:hypothetical protein n=1 Tax=Robertkochia aurantiaca TaxID=2873700 RepID=UPI001CCDCD4D|nr:hypothetical protein [Robertkochia sp. 3YJGBD-33]